MRLDSLLYQRDVLVLAPELVGPVLVRKFGDDYISCHTIYGC